MRSFRDRNPFTIAVVTLTVMLLILIAAFSTKHFTQHRFPISAEFSDAAGVSAGAPVRVAGVQVGQVTSVKPDRRNGRVIVHLAINRGVQLGPETHAEVALATLLGAKYVRLTGDVKEPFLAKGAVIPNDRTVTPYDIFELTKVATHQIEATDDVALNRLINQLAAITDGKAASVHTLIDGVAKLSTQIASRDAQLDDLVTRADTISNTLAVKDQTLAALLDQSDGILRVLASRHDQLEQGIHDASSAFGQLSGLVGTHKQELDSILDVLHPTVDILDKHQADLDRSLSWLGEGAYGLSRAAAHGPWADVYIRAVGPDVLGLIGALSGQGG
ncbi:MAG: phospholipid/cholesterol/gamma-HCH transport system substrate-binding protein [Actinomycetota bacterium]